MDNGNKTSSRECRFLDKSYFKGLYEAFIEAFSDYVIPFALTETQFKNHIVLNAVDLDQTAGYFVGDKLAGFSLNGFGDWDGQQTVYDAGTGVIPAYRRQGMSESMFEMMMPIFLGKGIKQGLLEVVTENSGAITLYKKLGYEIVRELALLQCDTRLDLTSRASTDVEVKEIADPDWELFSTFWDGVPSWQNSIKAVHRSRNMKRIFGAFLNGKCVGYIIFSSKFGRVAQFAVDPVHRRRGIGTALLNALHGATAAGYSLQVVNIDKHIGNAMAFLQNRGFYERLSQYEMVLDMTTT